MNQAVPHDIVIIGGGFAGCAAALRLAEHGRPALIIEYKAHLGGRATSYKLSDWPAPLDNGQHVLLGCCDKSIEFLRGTGSQNQIEWHRDFLVSDGRGAVRKLGTWPLPAPFHLIPFLLSYPGLSPAERMKIAWGVLNMAVSENGGGRWAETAERLGQTEQIQKLFWDPFLVSALNSDPEHMGTAYVRKVVLDAFMKSRRGLSVGIPRIPLVSLFDEHIRPALEKKGCAVQTGKRVLRFSLRPEDFVIHIHDQSALTAKRLILATSPLAAKNILEESTGLEETAEPIKRLLGGSPIISIHLLYDRPLTAFPFCQVQDRSIQWIFNKGGWNGMQHLQAIISAAEDAVGQSQMELVMVADEEVRQALGEAAHLVRGVAFIEKNATFPPLPDIARPRPDVSARKGLFLAGDYVDTGWPGTIESAVRSGFDAADAVLGMN